MSPLWGCCGVSPGPAIGSIAGDLAFARFADVVEWRGACLHFVCTSAASIETAKDPVARGQSGSTSSRSSCRRSRSRHQRSTRSGGITVRTAKVAKRIGLSSPSPLWRKRPESDPTAPATAAERLGARPLLDRCNLRHHGTGFSPNGFAASPLTGKHSRRAARRTVGSLGPFSAITAYAAYYVLSASSALPYLQCPLNAPIEFARSRRSHRPPDSSAWIPAA